MYFNTKKWVSILTLTFALLLLFSNTNQVHATTDPDDFTVKVKLKNNLGPSTTYQFIPKGDTILIEDDTIILKKDSIYKLAIKNSGITISEEGKVPKILKENLSQVTLEPKIYDKENFVLLQNSGSDVKRPHIGTIIFNLVTVSNTQYLQPINHLGFEDYLKGVLPGEMPASWGGAYGGQEALRAQAVAARSYIFAKMKEKNTLEIDDTINFQVYQGFVWDSISPSWNQYNANTTLAVDSTKGMIMTYQKTATSKGFVTGYFSASNGGQTELPQQYWTNSLPYIQKSQNDTFDRIKWSAPLQFEKRQLSDTAALDMMIPASWWSTKSENNLLLTDAPKSLTSFSLLKNHALEALKVENPSLESIKIDSVNNIVTNEWQDTGKVKDITFNLSYYSRMKTADNKLSYAMDKDVESETLSGDLRYDTAVEIAKKGWKGKRSKAILARGDLPVDALAGSVLAYKWDTPILLTRTKSLPDSVEKYYKESLNAGATIYLLGGEIAISLDVEKKLKALGYKTQRVAGKSRTDTSLEIAKLIGGSSKTVFFATGKGQSSDALSISPYAARKQIPIIIQNGTKVTKATSEYLKTSGKTDAKIIGGKYAIDPNVETMLKKYYSTSRIFGQSRVDTSIEINKKYPMPGETLFVGNAYKFIDAVSGSVLAAKYNSSMLLLHPDSKELPVTYLETVNTPKELVYLGGKSVISQSLKYSLSPYIGGKLHKFTSEFTLTGPQLRSLLGGTILMSTDFIVDKDTEQFVLNGTGYGHGIGMSQYGALNRSKEGKQSMDEILNFYYQGITIESANQYNNFK